MQPAGKSVIPNYIFPSTKEHFDLLKSLGSDRAFQSLTIHLDKSKVPYKTAGAEMTLKNGSTILIGAKGSHPLTANISRKVKQIHIESTGTNTNETWRWIRFYDDKNSQINCTALCNPLYTEDVQKKTIDQGYELIGVSLTIDSDERAWFNFLLWPEN